MKINKETRQLSKELLRASFTDGQLDNGPDRVARQVVDREESRAITSRCWKAYKRLLRLEVEKRTRHDRNRDRAGARTRARRSSRT